MQVVDGYTRHTWGSSARGYRPDGFALRMPSDVADPLAVLDMQCAQAVEAVIARIKGEERPRMVRLVQHVHLYGKAIGEFRWFLTVSPVLRPSEVGVAPRPPSTYAFRLSQARFEAQVECARLQTESDRRAVRAEESRSKLMEGLAQLGDAGKMLEMLGDGLMRRLYRDVLAQWRSDSAEWEARVKV